MIDYIGWAGNGNLGDDACLRAIRRAMAPREVAQTKATGTRPCILGGGTLIYGEAFLEPAVAATEAGRPLAVLGSGVDLAVPLEEWEPWRREAWHQILSRAAVVGVRGPESRAAAQGLGARRAEVIGDPALALGTLRRTNSGNRDRKLVLINAGGDFPPPCGRLRLLAECLDLVSWLQSLGITVEYLPLRRNDSAHAAALVDQCKLAETPCVLEAAFSRMRQANLVISLRLHGAVFAAACGVPFVSLGYWPKCRDFCKSVGVPWACVETGPGFSAAEVRAAVERLDREYDEVSATVAAHVTRYRYRQGIAAKKFAALAGGKNQAK